ncbi:MAG: hypothetical protein JO312_11075 [Hyphomicrobiales bacterium]|nr:hypothetical protein [Hyphomicrobiales bacterium]
MSVEENPRLLKCHVCGERLIVFARGSQSPEIGCLNCLASNDADKVANDGAGLIGGLLTEEEAQDLREQLKASGGSAGEPKSIGPPP